MNVSKEIFLKSFIQEAEIIKCGSIYSLRNFLWIYLQLIIIFYDTVNVEISRLLQYEYLFNVLRRRLDNGLISRNMLSVLSCLLCCVWLSLRKYLCKWKYNGDVSPQNNQVSTFIKLQNKFQHLERTFNIKDIYFKHCFSLSIKDSARKNTALPIEAWVFCELTNNRKSQKLFNVLLFHSHYILKFYVIKVARIFQMFLVLK